MVQGKCFFSDVLFFNTHISKIGEVDPTQDCFCHDLGPQKCREIELDLDLDLKKQHDCQCPKECICENCRCICREIKPELCKAQDGNHACSCCDSGSGQYRHQYHWNVSKKTQIVNCKAKDNDKHECTCDVSVDTCRMIVVVDQDPNRSQSLKKKERHKCSCKVDPKHCLSPVEFCECQCSKGQTKKHCRALKCRCVCNAHTRLCFAENHWCIHYQLGIFEKNLCRALNHDQKSAPRKPCNGKGHLNPLLLCCNIQ